MVGAMLASGLDETANVSLIALLAGGAVLVGLALLRFAPQIPEHWMASALGLGLVMVSVGVIAYGEAASPFTLLYVWISVEAWFFLRPREAVLVTLGTVVLSGVVMLELAPASDDRDIGAWWAGIAGSLLAMSALAAVLHGRAQRLIGMLGDAAVRDPLTGLLNRRGYQQRLEEELGRAARYGTPLSIVLGDLDRFKVLNDRHGHRHGDEALRTFADICLRGLRSQDFVSRVGGEEFALVLPHTTESAAVLVAERLRRSVAAELRGPDGVAVTASFGVATFPAHGVTAEILLDHADQAMYAAKSLGRDRTIAFAADLQELSPAALARREHLQAVLMIAETLDLRDAATHAHSETVARHCEAIAVELGLDADRVGRIRLAGLLHDIGKIGVADAILRKPGALEPEEWKEMRKHPELGARIVESAGLHDVGTWVLAHHERMDGAGYPFGLAGDEIPLEARILAIADAYEAMTADRPYRSGMGETAARAELIRCAGTQFDAELIAAFLRLPVAAAPA